jgi:hypothetical protein
MTFVLGPRCFQELPFLRHFLLRSWFMPADIRYDATQAGLVSCQDVPDASKLVLLNGFVDDVLGQGLLSCPCLVFCLDRRASR